MSPYNPKSAFTSESARNAQAKRKVRASGATKDNYKDLSAEMRRRAEIRWSKPNAKKQDQSQEQDPPKGQNRPQSKDQDIIEA